VPRNVAHAALDHLILHLLEHCGMLWRLRDGMRKAALWLGLPLQGGLPLMLLLLRLGLRRLPRW
jgi:hypothetical protein